MSSKITIVCFDINSGFEEDFDQSLGENILSLESPLRILDEFIETHLFLESEKIKKDSSEMKYSIGFNFSKNNHIKFDIIVLNDLSFIHDICLDASAYLVFINLEHQSTLNQLEKITKYILESCSMGIKTYIVGIYRDKITPTLNNESLEIFFEEQKLNYEYYEIEYKKDNDNNGINHICIQEYFISNKFEGKKSKKGGKIITLDRKNSKSDRKNSLKNYESHSLIDILELILVRIYEIKMNVKYEPDKKKFIENNDEEDNTINNSNSINGNCSIF